ncbi:hypothetical protein HKBW3S03_02116, partial [Candidatus Hakubella thermalkaliphila]
LRQQIQESSESEQFIPYSIKALPQLRNAQSQINTLPLDSRQQRRTTSFYI